MADSDEPLLPSGRREIVIRVESHDSLEEVLRRPLDFGCRPALGKTAEGSFTVAAIVTDDVLAQLQSDGFDVSVLESAAQRTEVGTGDRFTGGTTVPRGFAEKIRNAAKDAQ